MKTVILCGGQGTRLRERTESLPKPLVEIGAQPILWHIMKMYAAQDLREFVLCLGYRGEAIKDYFMQLMDDRTGDFRLYLDATGTPRTDLLRSCREPWDIIFAETGLTTDTGGRLHAVRDYLGGQTFCMTYGDGVADIDLKALVAFHRSHGKVATVTAVRPRNNLGVLRIDEGRCVRAFQEKPQMIDFVNGGFFVFEPSLFRFTTAACNLEKDVLPQLAAEGQLMAFAHDGFWSCMDTFKDTITLNELWQSGKAPWKVWPE